MPKEAGASARVKEKMTKSPKDNHVSHNKNQSNPNQKRDASSRSPLEGNPGKKQKEHNETGTEQMKEKNPERITNENKLNTDSHAMNPIEEGQPTLSTSLLQKLKEIKNTLVNLDPKIESSHQDLSSRMIDNKEIKDLLSAQNDKITMLYKENKELKRHITKLKKESLEMQEELLCLKVDISGIKEGTYETYNQLRSKVAEAMMSTCEGNTEEARWNTSFSVPLTDCQHLGTYNRNRKWVVSLLLIHEA